MGGYVKGGRTPPTQFFLLMVDMHEYYYCILTGASHYNTRTKYLPKVPLTNFRANLEEILGPGYKTL